MNKDNRTQFEIETEQYLERYNIFGLFQHLTEQLVLEKPKDPLGFILGVLEKPTTELVVVLAPPGSDFANTHAPALVSSLNAQFFNFHMEIKAEGLATNDLTMVSDHLILPLMDKIAPELKKLDQTRILFGFPKTLRQLHHLRTHKLYPHKVFVVNCNRVKLFDTLMDKLRSAGLSEEQGMLKAEEILNEYYG